MQILSMWSKMAQVQTLLEVMFPTTSLQRATEQTIQGSN